MPKAKKGPYIPGQKPPHEGPEWCGHYFPDCQILKDDPETKTRILHCIEHGGYTVPLNGHVPMMGEQRILTPQEHERAKALLLRTQSLTDLLPPL